MLGPPRGVPQRMAAAAFQGECRRLQSGFPLRTPCRAQFDPQPFGMAMLHAIARLLSRSAIVTSCRAGVKEWR